jgi:hypothetical protein
MQLPLPLGEGWGEGGRRGLILAVYEGPAQGPLRGQGDWWPAMIAEVQTNRDAPRGSLSLGEGWGEGGRRGLILAVCGGFQVLLPVLPGWWRDMFSALDAIDDDGGPANAVEDPKPAADVRREDGRRARDYDLVDGVDRRV